MNRVTSLQNQQIPRGGTVALLVTALSQLVRDKGDGHTGLLSHGLLACPQLPCITPAKTIMLPCSRKKHLHHSPFEINSSMFVILEVSETPNLSYGFKTFQTYSFFFNQQRENTVIWWKAVNVITVKPCKIQDYWNHSTINMYSREQVMDLVLYNIFLKDLILNWNMDIFTFVMYIQSEKFRSVLQFRNQNTG